MMYKRNRAQKWCHYFKIVWTPFGNGFIEQKNDIEEMASGAQEMHNDKFPTM